MGVTLNCESEGEGARALAIGERLGKQPTLLKASEDDPSSPAQRVIVRVAGSTMSNVPWMKRTTQTLPSGATWALRRALTDNPPYNARVTFQADHGATGWNAPDTAPWLKQAFEAASRDVYQRDVAWIGEGGTIPFMSMLGAKFPQAQFFITGVLGPHSNAHGPNEFLHVPYAKKLTAAVASVVGSVR